MMGAENTREQGADQWFTEFNNYFELSGNDSSSLQLLDDIPEKEFGKQEKEITKFKIFSRRKTRFKRTELELLTSQEEAEAVIICCLSVLKAVYGIQYKMPDSVKTGHLRKRGTLVEIRNIPGLCSNDKAQGKKKHQKNEGTITVLCNAPYISVVVAFLEICFGPVVYKRKDSGEEVAQSGERETDQSENGPQMLAWLVANCLYNMGELEYAEQYYIRKCQKGEESQELKEKWGAPWNVQGEDMEKLLKQLSGERMFCSRILSSEASQQITGGKMHKSDRAYKRKKESEVR